MNSLLIILVFIFGAFIGGYGIICMLAASAQSRVERLVDDDAIVYEDANTKVVRVSKLKKGDTINFAVIVHKIPI